ncbi:MAG: uroporphyrinogen-III synthase [Deltaproteobacteria bacterium]|nr:uroporphyrinogen-III synthase [Deltaproteobacteria bacterium]
MESTAKANLQGLRVVSFESRRAKEMAELIRRYGGEPIVAPSMREIPLSENHAALDLLPQLEAGEFDLLILMTGVGTRTLNEALRTQFPQERIFAALRKTTLVARGPKPVAVLKELGLEPALTAPEPNTWREVLATLSSGMDLSGKRIAVQEYGIPNPQLVAALESLGASVAPIPIYRWALPEDIGPLRAAIQKISQGEADLALFTNGAQVDHLFRVAAYDKAEDSLRQALRKFVIASVGPVCTQVLEQFGLKPDLEPAHPKMGALIAECAASAHRMLAAKRAV